MRHGLLFLAVVGAVLVASCQRRPHPAPGGNASAVPLAEAAARYLNTGTDASYVGMDACKTCHPDQYETYVQAEMGRSFKPATRTNSAARFEDIAPVYDPTVDLYYLPFHRGEALFIMEYRLAGTDTVFKRIEQIDYIVGSGQHTNSHIMEVNGYLYQMPLTWYAQEGRWDLAPKFAGGNNYRFSRPIPVECMACHNARPGFVQGSENKFTQVPSGIDCEQCHGPGSLHVAAKKAGQFVDVTREIDPTIVNPRKLPVDRQIDVCQRCHMQGAAVYRNSKTALDFRPGLALEEVENVFWPRFADSTRRFIMASHPDRLRMSACFTASHAGGSGYPPMSCITCHNPHVSIEAMAADRYSQACLSCHTAARDNLCTREAARPAEQEAPCASCHMPGSGTIDIPHVRITDHFIRRPGPPEAETGPESQEQELVRLAGLIDPTPSARDVADGYLTYYEEISNVPGFLDSAAVHLAHARRDTPLGVLAPSLIRFWFLQQDHGAIVRLAPTIDPDTLQDAWTSYRIGEALYQTGSARQAIPYLRRAVDRAPYHLRFMDRLAVAYIATRQLEDAVLLLNRLLTANPKREQSYNNRGFAFLLQRRFAEAEADFLAALALNPDAEQPLANLASLYYNTGRRDEAWPYVRRLRKLDPLNKNYQMLEERLRGNQAGLRRDGA